MAKNETRGRRLCNVSDAEKTVAPLGKSQPVKRITRFGREARIGLRLILAASIPVLCVEIVGAQELHEPTYQSDTIYILNTDPLEPVGLDASLDLESGTSFGAISSPTGVILPDATTYYIESTGGELTYLTPRVRGLQLSWTGDEPGQMDRQDLSHASGSEGYVSRPKSIGANFSEKANEIELSLGGDYGRTPKSVPGSVSLVNDEKLLRAGVHGGVRGFKLGSAFGSEADPRDWGETLSGDIFARYEFNEMSIGLVYNYTVRSDYPSPSGVGVPGTLQVGTSYFFTPRMAVSANLAYGNYVDQGGGDESSAAGVLGFSFNF